jgi:hypothetical protein
VRAVYQPVYATVGHPRVHHIPRYPNQKRGAILTLCGKRGWFARTTEEMEVDLPACAECLRREERG